jgi:NhaP-type Na+/H+ or K+/H+ antiporter
MDSSEENDRAVEEISMYFLLFAGLLASVIILSKVLLDHPRISSFMSEASLTLLVGIVAGLLVHFIFLRDEYDEYTVNYSLSDEDEEETEVVIVANSLLSFDPNVFFMALLPPILFHSGYSIRRELFYRHIKPILMYACVGTTISALSTAFMLYGVSMLGWMGPDSNLNTFNPSLLELLTFGSLIAATDTVSVLAVFQTKQVDPHLFYLVFGESALNDAVALVLFRTFAGSVNAEGTITSRVTACLLDFTFEFVGSPLLGIGFGFCTALLFKHMDFRNRPMLELPLYIVLLMYVPFITAESIHLSGIVTIFFSGTAARRYISPNVSEQTAQNAQVIFKMAAYLAETCIFLELGLSVVGLAQSFKWIFIAWAFLAALVSRALAIFPLTWLHNMSLKTASAPGAVGSSPPTGSNPDDDDLSVISTVSNMLTSEWKCPKRRMDKQISGKFATVLWFAGMRGAVAYGASFHWRVWLAVVAFPRSSHSHIRCQRQPVPRASLSRTATMMSSPRQPW